MISGKQRTFGDVRPVALVTGSAKRVGRVIAQHLADCGYRIAVHANTSMDEAHCFAKSLKEQGTEASAFQADLTSEASIRDMVDKVHFYFGRIDVLVNSASIFFPTPLDELKTHDVESLFQVNTFSVLLCSRFVAQRMQEQATGGAIVNIADWSVVRPAKGFSAYIASKGVLVTLTRSLAIDLAAENPAIRVNAVLPGQVLLPEGSSDAKRQAAIDATLVKRMGEPEDIAQAVHFLVESPFVTGVCLPVDGGRTVFGGQFADASVH
ncbi:SDR family oxidoreductase [Bremerella alba]|uniref:3-oxoacyl-[acyl-carrier-protein] reductase FabG n=1 Tax=Bremerella alba TaxID=980252 RepID=A0A7V8V982_9BACT|nr:SDR family oxidoreductase [Bremerella alba]MBA2117299.1 3-oxoacyl-[acyl-carrier-protein] reductase FabG [Bremerella alba]